MDILSKLDSRAKAKTIVPREIFMTLPSKEAGYGYPRDVQSEVWKKWFEIRNEKNVILKMNTGSGKTLVGLIMLQSCLNEEKGPAVYVVPDKYLVNQVIEEAEKLGIEATDDKDAYSFLNSKSILVTSVHKIVNGCSCFGLREDKTYPIGSIIIDDVHACMDKITSQFIITIKAGTDAYNSIVNILNTSLKDYNPKNYIDVIELKDYQKRLIVPYWVWQREQDDIYRILKKFEKDDDSIRFALPLLDRSLETCDCIITASTIEISPKGVDLDKITSFGEANRRIYMSATIADDSVFVSALGLSTEDMKHVITPENANDIGDRLVLFPKHINSNISELEIREKVEEIAKKYNVVILVPSFSRAKFWDKDGERTVSKENIDEKVVALKSKQNVGKVVFVNRYDGIDLPGDACRMLIIDGLPPLNRIKDRYIQSVVPQSSLLLREHIQKIEQGMGRGVRSNDDECCVVLMGDELSDVLSRKKGIDYFSVATSCQYNLSKELWDILVEEKGSNITVSDVFELARYSLEKEPKWIAKSKESLSMVKYRNEVSVDNKIVAQRKAFEKSLIKQWNDAANCIKHAIKEESDSRTKGYLYQILAEYTNKIDPAHSQEILRKGKELNPSILSPLEGIQYKKTNNELPQAQAIQKYLRDENFRTNDILLRIDCLLSNLYMGAEFDKFEDALCQIGEVLGFVASKPDTDLGGYGPDVLWVGQNSYFVIECKSESRATTISKDYCNQLSGSINWFKEQYGTFNKCTPIIVHPSKIVDSVASPNEDMRVMTTEKLEDLRTNVRNFYQSLCQSWKTTDIKGIEELLRSYHLRNNDIVEKYTVKYQREKSKFADKRKRQTRQKMCWEIYKDHYFKVESLITDDAEDSYKKFMDFKKKKIQDAYNKLENGTQTKRYLISEDGEFFLASENGKTLGYAFNLENIEELRAYLNVLKLTKTSELEALIADPQGEHQSPIFIKNDEVGVMIKTIGDAANKGLRFNIMVLRDLDNYQKFVKEYEEKAKN